MLWLCLRFPKLPLDIYLRGMFSSIDAVTEPSATASSIPETVPIVITEKHRVLMGNTVAEQLGMIPGMALSTVYALSTEVRAIERTPGLEEQTLQQLAQCTYQFTPQVTVYPPDSLLLEIQGSLKLYRDLGNLLRCIEQDAQIKQFHCQIGLAHTPKAAWVLACEKDEMDFFDHQHQVLFQEKLLHRLNRVAIQNLDISDNEKEKMANLGLSTLGEMLALPQAAVGKRIGKSFLLYLQKLVGHCPDPQRAITVTEVFHSSLHFMDGIINSDMLLFPMQRLLIELSHFLTVRQLHCRKMSWLLYSFNKQEKIIDIELLCPQNEYKNFLALTRLKLESLTVTEPIETLILETENFATAELKTQDLFSDLQEQVDTSKLLDKLSARLGSSIFYGIKTSDEHLPEYAWQTVNDQELIRFEHISAKKCEPESTRPLWLLKQPALLKNDKRSLYWKGRLTLLNGPERFDSQWWKPRQRRDYFIARHENGSLYWVYRDLKSRQWYLQGVFG